MKPLFAIVGVVISIYYYFGWIKAAYFSTWRPQLPEGEIEPAGPVATRVSFPMGVVLGLLAAASVVFGLYQGPIVGWLLSR